MKDTSKGRCLQSNQVSLTRTISDRTSDAGGWKKGRNNRKQPSARNAITSSLAKVNIVNNKLSTPSQVPFEKSSPIGMSV